MAVIALVYGHLVWTLIGSDATRCSISSTAILPLRLATNKDYTFFELGSGQKTFSKGEVANAPVVRVDITLCMDLTIRSLQHDFDLIFEH